MLFLAGRPALPRNAALVRPLSRIRGARLASTQNEDVYGLTRANAVSRRILIDVTLTS